MAKANDYSKLDKSVKYDEEAAEQLAAALNEINEHEQAIAQLRDLVDENKELHPFVWRTIEGKAIAIHKLDDDHLNNILQHQVRNGRSINIGLRQEARKRKILVPVVPPGYDPRKMLEDRSDW